MAAVRVMDTDIIPIKVAPVEGEVVRVIEVEVMEDMDMERGEVDKHPGSM